MKSYLSACSCALHEEKENGPVSEEIRFFPERDFEPSVSNAESQTVINDGVYSSA